MRTSTFLRAAAVLLLVVVGIGAGVAVFNAGVATGFAQAAAAGDGTPPPVPYAYGAYGWGPHFGFGLFGIVFWILGILLVIGLVRAAFGFGRWGGPARWMGPGGPGRWGGPGNLGPDEPRRRWIEEWHRELHGDRSEDATRSGEGRQTGGA